MPNNTNPLENLIQIKIDNGGPHWVPIFRQIAFRAIERSFVKEIALKYEINNIALSNDGKILLEWNRRRESLTEEEYYDLYIQ